MRQVVIYTKKAMNTTKAMSTIQKFRVVTNEASSGRATASFIFMHGSGGTGPLLRAGIKECMNNKFTFPNMRIVYPTAPLRPYTLLGGAPSNVWFDRSSLELAGAECLSSIDSAALELKSIVQSEIDSGIPENRIVIGGFSMGASMALHLGLRFLPNVAAIVSLSTFLYNSSEVFRMLENDPPSKRPPVLYCHGDTDDLININWGRKTCDRLSNLGVQATFKNISGLEHDINFEELEIIKSWLKEILHDI